MKIRIGFVSNSSSSSYVIALDIPKKCKECGRSDIDILGLIEASVSTGSSDENEIHAIGVENILREMKENWCMEDKDIKPIQKKIEKEVALGKKVASISISYHDETLSNLLDQPNIKILWRSE